MLKKTIIISQEVYKQLAIAAAEREITRLELIRRVLSDWLTDKDYIKSA